METEQTIFIVRYAEIGLKGRNRSTFERKLVGNIIRSLRLEESQVRREAASAQIVVAVDPAQAEAARRQLARVFGVAWFAEAQRCESDLENIMQLGAALAQESISAGDTFAVRATRSEKRLPFKSNDVEIALGDAIRIGTKATVKLKQPDREVFVYCGPKHTYIAARRIMGSGGLPVGSSRKVLSLISGGFDSIVSSYRMAKRGASVDFLHFHVYPDSSHLADSKMPRIWNKLALSTMSRSALVASDFPFQMAIAGFGKNEARYEQIVFRRMMVRVGEQLAQRNGYMALVLGDSLGQVASQTIENMTTLEKAVDIALFRPLIGMDKLEVINEVKAIGLGDEAAESYRDCCSILSSVSPIIRADLDVLEHIEAQFGMDEIVRQTVESVERVSINGMEN